MTISELKIDLSIFKTYTVFAWIWHANKIN